MSNLVSVDSLLSGLQSAKGMVLSKNEQEAKKLATHFTDTIFGVFKDKINIAGQKSEQDPSVKIPTGVKASIIIENPELLTQGGINSLSDEFISMVSAQGYTVKVSKSVDDILRYKEFVVEIKIPENAVVQSGLTEHLINIGQVNAEKVAKENFLSGASRPQVDYVALAEEAREEGLEVPLGGFKPGNIGVEMIN